MRGLRRTFQSLELFDDLTIEENVLVACQPHRGRDVLTDLVRPIPPKLSSFANAAITEFGLTDDLDRYPNELPYGRRRLVGIAQAVAVPVSLLLLDEPGAGLDPNESRELGAIIKQFARTRNAAIVLVEHDFDLIMSICDQVVALDFGSVIASGPPSAIVQDPKVRSAYLGTEEVEPVSEEVEAVSPVSRVVM
jgi:ABC-type branched-subunit amino acid transport system ATPase component